MWVEPSYKADGTPSTNWEWRLCKIKSPLQGRGREPASTLDSGRPSRYQGGPLTCTFRYRGGAESSWVGLRDRFFWRFPGWVCLDDALTVLARKGPQR
jgi:hypothetical protein